MVAGDGAVSDDSASDAVEGLMNVTIVVAPHRTLLLSSCTPALRPTPWALAPCIPPDPPAPMHIASRVAPAVLTGRMLGSTVRATDGMETSGMMGSVVVVSPRKPWEERGARDRSAKSPVADHRVQRTARMAEAAAANGTVGSLRQAASHSAIAAAEQGLATEEWSAACTAQVTARGPTATTTMSPAGTSGGTSSGTSMASTRPTSVSPAVTTRAMSTAWAAPMAETFGGRLRKGVPRCAELAATETSHTRPVRSGSVVA